MSNTTVVTKQTGDQFGATELNNMVSAINSKTAIVIVANYTDAVTAATGAEIKTIIVTSDSNYWLRGQYLWNGTSLQKLPSKPLLQNKEQLRDFYKQLVAFKAAPDSSYIAIANYGDSVSAPVGEEIFRKLDGYIPKAMLSYPSAMQSSLTLTFSGTAPSYSGESIGAPVSGNLDGTGGNSDFTFLGSSYHYTLEDGSVMNASGGQTTGFVLAKAVFAKGYGFGSVVIDLLALGTTTPVLQTATLNLAGVSAAGTGTITTTANSKIVTGVGTNFKTLNTGDAILLGTTFIGYVSGKPTSDTSLTLKANAAVVLSGSAYNVVPLTCVKAEFVLAKNAKYTMRYTSTGKCVHLVSAMLRKNGYLPCSWNSRGGSDLEQNNYANAFIRNYLANDFGIKLWVVQAKEGYATVDPQVTFDTLKSISNTSILACSSMPDVSNEASLITQNIALELKALFNGSAFFDNFRAMGTYSELVRLGWQGDGTHTTGDSYAFAVSFLFAELGLREFFNTYKGMINHDGNNNYVVTNKVAVFKGDFSGDEIPVIENTGGGSPTFALIQNIAKYFMGDKAAAAYIGGYGSEIATFANNGTFAPFRCAQFNAMATSAVPLGTNAISGSNGHLGAGEDFYLGNYTVAGLPASNRPYGALRFATDLKKIGETSGTGAPIYCSNGAWRRISDDSPISVAPNLSVGAGSPEGVITAPVGKLYTRTDGGAATTLYVKESGVGNTGWVAK